MKRKQPCRKEKKKSVLIKTFGQQRAISVGKTKNWLKEHAEEMRTELLGSAPGGQREHLYTFSLYPQRFIGVPQPEPTPVTSQDMLRAIRSLAEAAYRDPPESSG
ncbi:hypothetical protein VN97_g9197 [Penicillium thymicola]|uniref:Uncharacterized protein n=1 Tax=Penicillium thymicola TaxID=293382 RepID=A0AAI9X593_PENTH|nr:hypothetical protein VN97_g9197 [Penicillium thymicola]